MPANVELDPRFIPPGTLVGPYTIESLIDGGGQGVVYRVSRDGGVFTLKMAFDARVPLSEIDRRDIDARLRREFAMLQVIEHPNVVKAVAYEWWPDFKTGYPYFVMEHVDGDPVLRWQEETRPSLRAICGVFLRVAQTLRALHEHGIIHRDLKSDNLLIRTGGTPVLIDFGIARLPSAWTMTEASCALGTRAHLSPDFCRHLMTRRRDAEERYAFGPTDDTHAVGYMFYEMLVARAPFGAEDFDIELQLLLEIGKHVPQRPRELNPKVPAAVDGIVMALLEKEGERRMDAPALIAALEKALSEADAEWDLPFEPAARIRPPAAVLAAEPGAAEPGAAEGALPESPRVSWRRRAPVAVGALAIAVLAAFSAWSASRWTPAAPAAATPDADVRPEPPMPTTAEQGRPTVNDETKIQTPAPKAPTRTAAAKGCKVLTVAGMVFAACAHVKTGTHAGDCNFLPVHEVTPPSPEVALELRVLTVDAKLRIPPEMKVTFDSSNPGGECKGHEWNTEVVEGPCPIYEGPVILRPRGGTLQWPAEWYDPTRKKPSLLIGQTKIFEAKGTYDELVYVPDPRRNSALKQRDVVGRMTALITQLQTPDGKLWPVCGVLFGSDGVEGVPLLSPEAYGTGAGATWGDAEVRFFWPEP